MDTNDDGIAGSHDAPPSVAPKGPPSSVELSSLVPAMSRGHALRFTVTFAVLSGLFLGLYYFPYSEQGPIRPWLDGFLHRYAASAGFVLRRFEPQVQVIGSEIIGRYSLRIVKTCDAMDVTILLTSAIAAWPLPWKRRLAGVAAGIAFLFVLNVIRICTLYWIGIAFPSFFEVAHLDVWPAIILLVTLAFFWVIVMRFGAIPAEGRREPAS